MLFHNCILSHVPFNGVFIFIYLIKEKTILSCKNLFIIYLKINELVLKILLFYFHWVVTWYCHICTFCMKEKECQSRNPPIVVFLYVRITNLLQPMNVLHSILVVIFFIECFIWGDLFDYIRTVLLLLVFTCYCWRQLWLQSWKILNKEKWPRYEKYLIVMYRR